MTNYSAEERLFQETELNDRIARVAERRDLNQTLSALSFAAMCHMGQRRKGPSRLPFIIHPLTVASHALALGYREDSLLAGCLLHDTCEDCNIAPEALPVGKEVQEAVRILTYVQQPGETRAEAKARYFAGFSGTDEVHRLAILTKLMDRCHNLSSMVFAFTPEKMQDYIDETNRYVLPLIAHAREAFPRDEGALYALDYLLRSMMNTISIFLGNAKQKA